MRITFDDNDDDGIGFDKKFKENIIALFQQRHSKERFEGAGIGFAIICYDSSYLSDSKQLKQDKNQAI